ncbi:MAG: NAAT family transporter [Actinobacteria bacterium]|jgi:multiple antibiotic resistance protein|nr:NAAT family transporter [Actinomycetota bacterium]
MDTAILTLGFTVFVTLLVIMDPPGTMPVFMGLVSNQPPAKQKKLARQAVLTAFSVIVAFAIFGDQILGFLNISLPALQASGGLLLLLVALELLTGKDSEPTKISDVSVALVPLGTPLLAGPGAIAATIVFVRQAESALDYSAIAIAILLVHVVLYAVMRFAVPIMKVLKAGGVTVATKLAGLLLAAIAVQMIAEAIAQFVRDYV